MPKNVTIAAALPAAPEKLYEMYLDAKAHTAFTGQPVSIEAMPGAPFSAFGGILTGKMLHVEPKRLIVQTWRSGNWAKEDLDSVLVLTFWPEPKGGRIELLHLNVPESDFAGVSHGWEKYYWTPWRAYLEHESKA
ncbi:MAG: SRPBCC domain-containing protein [Planctomycetes bacterium]|nr:SRPBCC domain-containing protein [Planctomycetota bacterium]